MRTLPNRVNYLRGRRRPDARGAELVEMAFVLPLLIMLLIGIFWMGRAFFIYETITRAAREGARFAAAPKCATCGGALPSAAEVQAVVDGALSAASLAPAQKTSYSFQQNVTLNPGSNPAETGVTISFGYPVQLVIPFTPLNASTISINTKVQMRQENQ